MPSLALRCDADGGIGLGHLMRCQALAVVAAEAGWSVRWLVRGQAAIAALPDATVLAGTVSDPPLAGAASMSTADWAVVDHYGADDAGLRSLAPARTLTFDDHQRRAASLRVAPWDAPAAGSLTGAAHIILRPAFAKPAVTHRTGTIVAFGGADSEGWTALCLAELARIRHPRPVAVLTTAAARQAQDLDRAVAALPAGGSLHYGLDAAAVAALFAGAVDAVCACSTVAVELQASGVRIVAVPRVDNQEPLAGLLVRGGVPVARNPIAAVAALVQATRHPHIDGLGAWRVAAAMGITVTPPLPPLVDAPATVEPVSDADSGAIWAINTAADVRRWSVRQTPIPWHDHERWWTTRSGEMMVARIGGIVAACARRDADGWMNVAVHPSARRRGLAALLLRRLTPGRRCLALIHRDNQASLGLFSACGYAPYRSADANGFTTLIAEPS